MLRFVPRMAATALMGGRTAGKISLTSDRVWIAVCAVGTNAFVMPFLVDALRSQCTRIVFAFVHVLTTVQRISFVTGQTQTLRRIAWCALRVDAARESIARACLTAGRVNNIIRIIRKT